jgi:pimeloyl-ACP methyl ester carboxylesterase
MAPPSLPARRRLDTSKSGVVCVVGRVRRRELERVEQRVTLSTGDVRYRILGEGQPLVYLHPGGGVDAAAVIAGLAASHKVVIPFEPPFDGTQSARALAGIVAELIDAAVGESCDVVGSGGGANVAAWLAVLRPDRVAHLVLAAPAFVSPDDDELLDALGNVERLMLILQGTRDAHPVDGVQRLRRLVRSSFLVYVWDAGRTLEVDQPARVLALIDSFLKRSESFIVNWGTLAVNP